MSYFHSTQLSPGNNVLLKLTCLLCILRIVTWSPPRKMLYILDVCKELRTSKVIYLIGQVLAQKSACQAAMLKTETNNLDLAPETRSYKYMYDHDIHPQPIITLGLVEKLRTSWQKCAHRELLFRRHWTVV